LMAGESPYAMQNLGKAGLGVLASKQAQKKADSTERYQDAMTKRAEAQGKYLEKGEKDEIAFGKLYETAVKNVEAALAKDANYTTATPAVQASMRQKALYLAVMNNPTLAMRMGTKFGFSASPTSETVRTLESVAAEE